MINSLAINGLTISEDTGYILTGFTGFAGTDIRSTITPKVARHGSVIWNQKYSGRVLSIEGHIDEAGDYAELREKRNALLDAFSIDRGKSYLIINTTDGETFVIRVATTEIDGGVAKSNSVSHLSFRLELTSEDYRFWKEGQNLTDVYLSTGGGTTFPASFPMTFAPTTGGSVIVTNNGSAPADPDIIIYGPVTNPYVLNTTTGEYLSLNITIDEGSYVRIYEDEGSMYVMQGGTTNRYSDFSGTLFKLQPGANVISYTASTYSSNSFLEVYHFHSYLSI